ncbi:DUF1127 domain-containing protein [Marivivens sp. LCG002]|uniref:DUF1127 domain-containing protein n=1 Tax=Marivivens sp. LCG002 TaxID=3051171 RepID=UPI00255584B1|nr:DUF1127 domain-containing protein [Marivivens sp. LCG002]WIV52086.1 DUF1127 domain-containing protein [Marivivens sp. LCG002]
MATVTNILPLNTIVIPAPTTTVARALVATAVAVETWAMRRSTRKHLKDMPDYLLQDIGLTHVQADQETRKVFWRA